MATIGFIGLGNMGAPMAANLVKAGHQVRGFDIVAGRAEALRTKGGRAASTMAEVAAAGNIVITISPAAAASGIIDAARPPFVRSASALPGTISKPLT